ncbi:carotene biosynthesis protein [Halobacteriales archaeon SW_10_68_16]|jgi:putative membrane protein|nr:MAG: carotene biosynthesis protein [Halobacteriales archaeon SW_10_68_16]
MNRAAFEREFDAFVTRNRFTIAVVFPLVGAVLLVASAQSLLPPPLAFNPYLVLTGVLVMRLPLVAGLFPLVGRRGAALLFVLAGYAYGIEYVGATTGLPYGEFAYQIPLGPMLSDTIPLGLPVFFMPLVLNAYLLCLLLLGERARSALVRVPVVVAAVVAVDLVLDPAAVALGFWAYESGSYYGVPWLNFAGWVLSATVATMLVDAAFDRTALLDRVRSCPFVLDDLVSFVLLWGAVNAFYRAWVSVAVALLFAVGLVRLDRFDFAVFRRVPGRQSG